MKNGQVIDLRNKSALYFKEYNDKKNVILFTTTDTIRNSEDSLKVYPVTKIIELDSVKKVTIEKWETNVAIPVTAVLVFVGLILLGFAMTFSMNLGGH